jgi:hypothetical protein
MNAHSRGRQADPDEHPGEAGAAGPSTENL